MSWPTLSSAWASTVFAELSSWYFGSRGELRPGMKAESGPGWLQACDPDAYALVDRIYRAELPTSRVVHVRSALTEAQPSPALFVVQ